MTARSPRGHYLRAKELRTIVEAPSIVKYRLEPSAPVRVEYSNKRLEYTVDICLLAQRCNHSGWLIAYLEGARWESVPERIKGRLSADIRAFRRTLREGGYRVD